MTLAIIDYGSGNLRSVAKAFERVSGRKATGDARCPQNRWPSHIVLPGVGAFADCMNGLKSLPGMLDVLEKEIIQCKKPFLGICVGMQMLFEKGHEHGVHDGLGWLKGRRRWWGLQGKKIIISKSPIWAGTICASPAIIRC